MDDEGEMFVMKNVRFEFINTYGQVVEENEGYSFYHLEEVKNRYDSNFIELLEMPTIEEFKQLVEELRILAIRYGNEHGNIVFPEGLKPSEDLIEVAKDLGFEWGIIELYKIKPYDFVGGNRREKQALQIGWITPELVDAYCQMHYEEKVQTTGDVDYATAMLKYKRGLIERGEIRIVVAMLNDKIVGSTDLIWHEQFVEIDNFFVKPNHQKEGIGTAIQQFVMKEAGERTVILVADGQDSPREMYRKQGYQYVNFRYEALCEKLVK